MWFRLSNFKIVQLRNSTLSFLIIHRDRLDLSWDDGIFGQSDEGQEIIEEYNEEREKEWRERHRIRMREQKKREAYERQHLLNEEGDKDYMAILEEAELMEELETELEEMNVDSDETLRAHLQTGQSNNSDNLTEEHDDSGDELASAEFIALSKQVANRSDSEKMKVYEERLSQITDYLNQNKESNSKSFNEFVEKQMEKGNLEDAIEELREGMNELSTQSSIEKPMENQPRAKQSTVPSAEKRKFNTAEDYRIYEKECRDQNKTTSQILIFYKCQLRSLMKTLASCTIDLSQNDDKTDLYEFICDRIDDLRFTIHTEKQIKAEEDFVDDEDIGRDQNHGEYEPDNGMEEDDDAASGGRKISFASEPIVTTFDENDEPWRVQMENNEEHLNELMDSTFQFFDDEQCAVDNNINECVTPSDPPSIDASTKDCMESSNIPRPETLILRFRHSTNECTTVTSDSNNDATIRSPLDISKQFGAIDSDETKQNVSTEPVQTFDKDTLKDYVMNVANLDVDGICRQMRENFEKRNAMKIPMENEKLNESNASSDIPNIDSKPKKSILKNRHAVSLETHHSTSIDDDDDEDAEEDVEDGGHCSNYFTFNVKTNFEFFFICSESFYLQNEPDECPFEGFTQVMHIIKKITTFEAKHPISSGYRF